MKPLQTSLRLDISRIYQPLFKGQVQRRYIALWGGRGRGASYTATALFCFWLLYLPRFRGLLLRQIYSDLRSSLFQGIKDRLEALDLPEGLISIRDHDMSVRHVNGNSIISKGFRKSSGNRSAKLKSIEGVSHVLIEEADEVEYGEFSQLDETIRSADLNVQIILLFNPPAREHWIIGRWFDLGQAPISGYYTATPKADGNLAAFHATYRDNAKNISPSTAALYESYRATDPARYYTQVEGYISEGVPGLVYPNWQRIGHEYYLSLPYEEILGLDWGYNDPLALVGVKRHKQDLYLHQYLYASRLLNSELVARLRALGFAANTRIVADSANPKDIQELRKAGFNVWASYKGPDSIAAGIRQVRDHTVWLTSSSEQTWRETRNYAYRLDQHGYPTEHPIDAHNHAMDAIRYALSSAFPRRPVLIVDAYRHPSSSP